MTLTHMMKNKKHVAAVGVGIILVVLILSKTIGTAQADKNDATITAPTTQTVELLDLTTLRGAEQTIATTGEVESLEQVELRSEVFGKISYVGVSLGAEVYPGQTIASLSNGDLAAQRAQAEADVERAIVTKEQFQAQYDAGVANHEKIRISAENAVASALAALDTAKNNVRQNESNTNSEIVREAYEDMIPTLQGANAAIGSILQTSDNLLGVDSNLANQSFKDLLSILDITRKSQAELSYKQTKQALQTSRATMDVLSDIPDTAVIDATLPLGSITQTILDAQRASIHAGSTSINATQTNVNTAKQAIATAKKSLSQFQIAYEKAQRDYIDSQAQATADIQASAAQIQQLEANIRSQETQITRARATVRGINASIGKTIVRSPIRGTVAVLPAKAGEIAQTGALIASIVNTNGMQIKTYVDSESLAGIHVGNVAYNNDTPIGTITHVAPSIDPATKKVEVLVALNEAGRSRFVIGQFADIDLVQSLKPVEDTAESLLIPLTAVRIEPTKRTVFVLNEDMVVEERDVVINRIVGDKIEVTAGLEELDAILLSTRGVELGEVVTIAQ